jgi:putative ABC transport system permease protein
MDAAALAQMSQASMDETSMAAMLDAWLESTDDTDLLVSFYDEYIGGSSYEDNMEAFGKVSFDTPSSISIYTDSFEDKEGVSAAIEDYNKTVDEEQQITYTDYVALMTSSLTSIIDMISYVLIAFIAVSLIVSCIMIGIITHISVLERTKEIGILRALGASKANISQVFNAETLLIGLFSGLIGVGVSALLTIPINSIIAKVLESNDLTVALPMQYALVLVLISVVITMLGGWIPAKKAAKKDPVIALRTE